MDHCWNDRRRGHNRELDSKTSSFFDQYSLIRLPLHKSGSHSTIDNVVKTGCGGSAAVNFAAAHRRGCGSQPGR
ncbi:hypothetical protein AGR1B_Lc10021 [Agrobacterium fabacearum S56]|nr:hypothetical protein AGR1B_Lc10021 [Agrobacterium fabacearum S56]